MSHYVKTIDIGPPGDIIAELFFEPLGFNKEQVIENISNESFVRTLVEGIVQKSGGTKKPLWYMVHQITRELQRLVGVLEGTSRMDEGLAEILGMTLNVDPSFFMYLQARWDEHLAENAMSSSSLIH